jgi:septal ring factor EnvC (AmiA/AmiB activator)
MYESNIRRNYSPTTYVKIIQNFSLLIVYKIMDIATKDKIFSALRSEIKSVQSGILDQLQDIGEIQNENEFLVGITDDYKRYHSHMLNQKKQERKHLEILVDYLEKSLMEAGMTETVEKRVRFEQDRILKSLGNVKTEIEEIISKDTLNEQTTD